MCEKHPSSEDIMNLNKKINNSDIGLSVNKDYSRVADGPIYS